MPKESSGNKYYSPDNVYLFAEYLYEEGDYERAAGEYHRYLFMTADSLDAQKRNWIYFKLGKCSRLTGNYSKALAYFENIGDFGANGLLQEKRRYQISLCYFLAGDYDNAILKLSQNGLESRQVNRKKEILTAMSYLYQKRWSDALNYLDRIEQTDSLTAALKNFALGGKELSHKDKFTAGALSALVPGLGKVYCNRPGDGLFSMLMVGLTGWQAYRRFDKDGIDSVSGWIYGGLSGAFYLGNIYGSAVAADIYNERQEEKILSKIRISINVDTP